MELTLLAKTLLGSCRDSYSNIFGALSLVRDIVVKCFHLFGGSFEKYCVWIFGRHWRRLCVVFLVGSIVVETLSSSLVSMMFEGVLDSRSIYGSVGFVLLFDGCFMSRLLRECSFLLFVLICKGLRISRTQLFSPFSCFGHSQFICPLLALSAVVHRSFGSFFSCPKQGLSHLFSITICTAIFLAVVFFLKKKPHSWLMILRGGT